MAGMGFEGAYGAAGTFKGLQDWMTGQRKLVEDKQADTLFQQGQEDRTAGIANEQEIARNKVLAAQQEAQQKEEWKAQVKTLGLPKLAEIGAMISIDRGQMPQGLIDALKPKTPRTQFAPNGELVNLDDPEIVGQNFAAPKAPVRPRMQIAPNGQVVNLDDPAIAGQNFRAPHVAAPVDEEARRLAHELAQARLDDMRTKQTDAAATKTKDTAAGTQAAADAIATIDRLLAHPGLSASTGAYEMRGFTQPARDFRAELNRFVAQQTKGNLGTLKGPMSDKDIAFIKQMSTTAADTNLSDEALVAELQRARDAYAGGGGAKPGAGGGGGPKADPLGIR